MARTNRKTAYPQLPKSPANYVAAILKGVALSIIISVICALLLSVLILIVDNNSRLEEHLEYVMIGVTLVSIFTGSAYAARKISSTCPRPGEGILVGISIGIIYVLFSAGVGSDLGQNQILLPMLGNKIAAGSLAGALGGFIGVNL